MFEVVDELSFNFWLIFIFFRPALLAMAVVWIFALAIRQMLAGEVPCWWTIPIIAACTAAAHFTIEYDSESLCLPPEYLGAALGCILANAVGLLLRKTVDARVIGGKSRRDY